MKTIRFAAGLSATVVLLVAACASVSVNSAWRDPTYQGPPFKNVMVFAWVDRPSVRRTVEDIFVGDLTRRGLSAVASYTLIPDARDVKRAAVVEAAKKSGVDSVLVNRLQGVDLEVQEMEVQPFITPDPSDVWTDYPIGGAPVTVDVQSRTAYLMSNLYDAKTQKMVWWGKMDAAATKNAAALARGMAGRVLSALGSAGLL